MAHGRPDWGLTSATVFTYPMTDLGELAVRLGSIDFFERRGDVLCLDGFEEGLGQWRQSISGMGAKVGLSNLYPKSGAFNALLIGGSTSSRSAIIWRRMALPAPLRLGFEFSFTISIDTEIICASLATSTGLQWQRYKLRYHHVDGKLQVWDSDCTWKDVIASVTLDWTTGLYHVIKIAVDPTIPCYERVLLDSDLIDISDYHPEIEAVVTPPKLHVGVEVYSVVGENAWAHIDNVIVTQDEP